MALAEIYPIDDHVVNIDSFYLRLCDEVPTVGRLLICKGVVIFSGCVTGVTFYSMECSS